MQEQKLTLENFDDLALELLRKENYDSSEIKFEWGYSDKFTKEDIEKIRDIKEKMGFDYLEDAVNEYLFDINSEVHFEMQNQIIDKVLNKYVDSDSPDYDEISEKLSETLGDYFTLNMNGEAVLENTDVGEINIFLCSDNEKKLYEESFALESDDIFKKDGFEKILSDYEDETMYCFHTRENIFRGNLRDEELLERYDIKKEDFIIYSQNGDKLYDSESSLPTRDLEEYIINLKGEEYWDNLKLNDVKSWDNLLKEKLVIGQMKSTEEEFEDYEEYTRNHLEKIADYTITEAKLIFGEVRQDLIRNSEKGLISEEKLEMLENRYSNFNEKEVKVAEKDSRVKSEEYWLNKNENNKDKYKEEISNIKANFLSSFLKDNIPNYEKMSSAIELPKEDLKEKLNGDFNNYCLENYIWENDSLKEKIHNNFPLNELVKRYGLEDELLTFKVYDNEDELLFDSGSKENNIKKIKSFIERIDKVEFLNDLLKDTNMNKIENWSKIANYDNNELMTITFNNDFFFEEETEYINSNNYEEYLGMNLTEKIDDNIDYEVLSYTNTVKDKLLELINEKEVLTKKDTEKLIEDLSSNSKEKVVKEVEEVKEKGKEIDM